MKDAGSQYETFVTESFVRSPNRVGLSLPMTLYLLINL